MNSLKLTEMHYRKAIKAYLHVALSLFVKHEAKISFWDYENFGDTANIICSLNRAIEHLLKLKLIKIDISLLYKSPKDLIEYCIINQIPFPKELINFCKEYNKKDLEKEKIQIERILYSRTIDFKESIKKITEIIGLNKYNFKNFIDIHNLRNYLEHNWSGKEEEFLKRIIDLMAYEAIPIIKGYIANVLEEDYEYFFNQKLLEQMEELNEAIKSKHSIVVHRRYTEIKELYNINPELCKENFYYPEIYKNLWDIETKSECPVCNNLFLALFDLEADYDYVNDEGYMVAGVYPVVKCLHCNKCCFYVEGIDIKTYLPDFSVTDLDEYFKYYKEDW